MRLVDLAQQDDPIREQAAALLVDGFHEPRGWPTLAAALDCDLLLGWIGGLPELAYQSRVWELHPIVVRPDRRRRGIGRALVAAFEAEAGRRGALTVTLGTDDDAGMTSLADVDLYADLPRHLSTARDLGRGHPFAFYQRLGYVITGVMPDANGPGRPDIYMSKSLRR